MPNLLLDGSTLLLFLVATTEPGFLPGRSPGAPAFEQPPVTWSFLDPISPDAEFNCNLFMVVKPWRAARYFSATSIREGRFDV